jgi:hypothetical protein
MTLPEPVFTRIFINFPAVLIREREDRPASSEPSACATPTPLQRRILAKLLAYVPPYFPFPGPVAPAASSTRFTRTGCPRRASNTRMIHDTLERRASSVRQTVKYQFNTSAPPPPPWGARAMMTHHTPTSSGLHP